MSLDISTGLYLITVSGQHGTKSCVTLRTGRPAYFSFGSGAWFGGSDQSRLKNCPKARDVEQSRRIVYTAKEEPGAVTEFAAHLPYGEKSRYWLNTKTQGIRCR